MPQAPPEALSNGANLYMVRVLTLRSDADSPEADSGLNDGVDLPSGAEAPVTLKVDFWQDREPDVTFDPLPPWLAAAVLQRASELAYDMAEAEWEEAHTDPEEDD